MFSLLASDVFQKALLGGTVAAVMAGVVGYFLVLRVQAFAAESFMDICFAGATGASLLGQPPLVGMIVFSLLSALSLGALGERARGRSVEIGMVLSFALGLGVLFLSIYTRSSASHSNPRCFGPFWLHSQCAARGHLPDAGLRFGCSPGPGGGLPPAPLCFD